MSDPTFNCVAYCGTPFFCYYPCYCNPLPLNRFMIKADIYYCNVVFKSQKKKKKNIFVIALYYHYR